jgi:four helix bundle protein
MHRLRFGCLRGCSIVTDGPVMDLSESQRRFEMGQSYRDLIAWQKAMELVTTVYRVTKTFPVEERYALSNQLRRAAVSVPSNIAEGQARFSPREFYRFLSNARGSLVEIETQLQIGINLGYLTAEEGSGLFAQAAELGRILNGLLSSIKFVA